MFEFLLTVTKTTISISLGRYSFIMVIHRKLYEKLKEWKESSDQSKAILIKGVRRVGKSYLSLEFAKNEYKSYILIDISSLLPGTLQIFKKYGNKYLLDEFLINFLYYIQRLYMRINLSLSSMKYKDIRKLEN